MPRSREDILPNSRSNAICPICHEVFSTAGNFDKHRIHSKDGKFRSLCKDPEDCGMILNEKKLWITESDWFKEKE